MKKKGKYGFLDAKGKPFIAAKYHKAEPFNARGLAKVWLDEYFWGYVDKQGREYFER